jgi:hypothetical protein
MLEKAQQQQEVIGHEHGYTCVKGLKNYCSHGSMYARTPTDIMPS